MYKDLLNNEVVVVAATRGDRVFEYAGTLCEEDENLIKIKNCEFCPTLQHSCGGTSSLAIKNNTGETIINKKYIIACYKK